MSRLLKWLGRIALVFLGVLLVLAVIAALMPIPADPALAAEEYGAGASSVEPSYSGLQREFPALNEPADNPLTEEKAALGRLLFFDPILSDNNEVACATCHQPHLGFSDGLAVATGVDGTGLDRNTPTLWNVGFSESLFWDGREDSLEAQVLVPLTHPNEMAVDDTAALITELQSIPEYVTLFENAFGNGNSAISLEHLQQALASFERTLVTQNSPFDQYAAGEFDALTPAQRRGLVLFRSAATRCFECHSAPTFANNTFRVVGVDSGDLGRGGISDSAPEGAFRVPTLRNIALTAPYMHNGAFATLEEVIDFYAEGGGRSHEAANVDSFVIGFELTNQEKADLIAFLYALTDESNFPDIPAEVPSGLPVIETAENPGRETAAEFNAGVGNGRPPAREPMTHTVMPDQTIQSVVDQAQPGDTIEVSYGLYHERVVVDVSNITLVGVPNDQGQWPILDGQGELSDGIISSGNNFTVGNFQIRNYNDNGVLVEGATGVHFHDIYAENVGTYGIYPVQSTGILIERVEVTGVDDAGIYAGQSEDIIVRDNVVYGNVIGIELENTVNGEVYNNHAYNNTTGIFIVVLPNLTSKISTQTRVYDNEANDNNLENFAPEGATAGFLPPGIGILLLGADNAEVYNNTVTDNKTVGIGLYSLDTTGVFENLDIGPNPENNYLHDNIFDNNGYDPDEFVADLGIPTGDILWDVSGGGNTFNEPDAKGNFPPFLPGNGWPNPLQKVYWQTLHFLIGLVA